MQIILILLNILCLGSVLVWFMYASNIFLIFKDNSKGNTQNIRRVLLALSYSYPFILAYFLNESWELYDQNRNYEALFQAAIPLVLFVFGLLLEKILKKV